MLKATEGMGIDDPVPITLESSAKRAFLFLPHSAPGVGTQAGKWTQRFPLPLFDFFPDVHILGIIQFINCARIKGISTTRFQISFQERLHGPENPSHYQDWNSSNFHTTIDKRAANHFIVRTVFLLFMVYPPIMVRSFSVNAIIFRNLISILLVENISWI